MFKKAAPAFGCGLFLLRNMTAGRIAFAVILKKFQFF
jgi:hypothetical protein